MTEKTFTVPEEGTNRQFKLVMNFNSSNIDFKLESQDNPGEKYELKNLTLEALQKKNKAYKQFDNTLSEKSSVPCIKESRMCSTSNHALQIDNPRRILLENIRETCVYQEFGQEVYWNYMTTFNTMCFDGKNPLFNEECALSVFI